MIRKNRWYQRGKIILKAATVLLTTSILVSMAQLSACAATTWTFWGDEEEIPEDDSDTVCVTTVYKGQTEQFLDLEELEEIEGEITWSVDRPEVLDIGPDGELIPLKVGNAMVTAIVKIETDMEAEPEEEIENEENSEAGEKTEVETEIKPEEEMVTEQTEETEYHDNFIFGQDNEAETGDIDINTDIEEETEKIYQYHVSVCKKKAYKAVKKAQNALGAAYSQAKRMKKGYYDCSSLIWRSYSPYGITFGEEEWAPTAADQGLWCEENGKALAVSAIDLAAGKLLPGDLIYYTKNVNNGRYKNIYHVAMFEGYEMEFDEETGEINLSGTIIEASGTSVVRNTYRSENGSLGRRIALIGRPTK